MHEPDPWLFGKASVKPLLWHALLDVGFHFFLGDNLFVLRGWEGGAIRRTVALG